MRSATTALALASVIVAASCGANASTATAPSQASAAPVARLVIPTEGTFPLGIQNQTALAFDASSSIGDGLKYRIEFGDGEEASTSVAYHVGRSVGVQTARLTVTDSLGRTSSAVAQYATVDVANGIEEWWSNEADRDTADYRLRLDVREDHRASIWLSFPETFRASTTWDVSGAAIQIRSLDGAISLEGRAEWIGDNVNANYCRQYASECIQLRLRGTGGPLSGRTFTFRRRDSY